MTARTLFAIGLIALLVSSCTVGSRTMTPILTMRESLTREITSLDLSSPESAYAGEIAAERLDLRLSGAGKTVIRSLNADILVVEHSGVGGLRRAQSSRGELSTFQEAVSFLEGSSR